MRFPKSPPCEPPLDWGDLILAKRQAASLAGNATSLQGVPISPDVINELQSLVNVNGTFIPLSVQIINNVQSFGAKGDGQRVTDGTIGAGSHSLTSPSALFKADDADKLLTVYGAGAGGAPLATTIATYVSPTNVLLVDAAGTSVGGDGEVNWGTDDSAAINATIVAARTSPYSSVVYFPPGVYCTSVGFAIDNAVGDSGLQFVGANSGGQGEFNLSTRICLMRPQPYLLQHRAERTRFTFLWFDGNFLASDVLQFEYFSTENDFDGVVFSGATVLTGNIHHYGNAFGQLEIDFLAFYRFSLINDPWLFARYAATCVYNENAEAFFIMYDAGEFRHATNLFRYRGGSCDVYNSQVFQWTHACILLEAFCQPCTFWRIYNEQDTAPFLLQSNIAAATSSLTFTLRDIQLQSPTGIYWTHQMRLSLQNVSINAVIISDPAAAVGFDGVQYGIQPISMRDVTFLNGNNVQYDSGIPGQLVEEFGTLIDEAPTTVTDGVMSSSVNPTFFSSATAAFTSLFSVGAPISVAGAGPAGGPLNTFIAGFINADTVILAAAASTTVSGATASFGQIVLRTTRPESPGEIVGDDVGYDANGVYLAVGVAPTNAGVPLVAADLHVISFLSQNRTFTLSGLGVASFGVRMKVSRYGATDVFAATILYDAVNLSSISLLAGQTATFEYIPNNGWILIGLDGSTNDVYFSNSQSGKITLVGGTATISTGIIVDANSTVFLTRRTVGGTVTTTVQYEAPAASMVVGLPGTGSITINAYEADGVTVNTLDTSVVGYLVLG
jgi:Pectate lyase superfamily protein